MKLSSASYCASLVASLKPKSSIRNEPAQGTDKSPTISDYSHCRFTGLLCSDQSRSLKHLIPTVGEGPCTCQQGGSASRAKKFQTTEKQKQILPMLPLSVFFDTITHAETFTTHAHGGFLKKHYFNSPCIKANMYTMWGPICSKEKLFLMISGLEGASELQTAYCIIIWCV